MAELILAKLIDMAHDEKHMQNKMIAAEVKIANIFMTRC